MLSSGGLYRVHNHPKAEYTNNLMGYGLRVDGLFDGSADHLVVFDFDRNGAKVHIKYDKAAGALHLFGLVYGGTLNGTASQCNAKHCVFLNPK